MLIPGSFYIPRKYIKISTYWISKKLRGGRHLYESSFDSVEIKKGDIKLRTSSLSTNILWYTSLPENLCKANSALLLIFQPITTNLCNLNFRAVLWFLEKLTEVKDFFKTKQNHFWFQSHIWSWGLLLYRISFNKQTKLEYTISWQSHQVWGFFTFFGDLAYCAVGEARKQVNSFGLDCKDLDERCMQSMGHPYTAFWVGRVPPGGDLLQKKILILVLVIQFWTWLQRPWRRLYAIYGSSIHSVLSK